MTHYSRGQQAQIAKRVRLRGDHEFTAKDRKCVVCGHQFKGPSCVHGITENQDAIDFFKVI